MHLDLELRLCRLSNPLVRVHQNLEEYQEHCFLKNINLFRDPEYDLSQILPLVLQRGVSVKV